MLFPNQWGFARHRDRNPVVLRPVTRLWHGQSGWHAACHPGWLQRTCWRYLHYSDQLRFERQFFFINLPALGNGLFFTESITSNDVLLTVNRGANVPPLYLAVNVGRSRAADWPAAP